MRKVLLISILALNLISCATTRMLILGEAGNIEEIEADDPAMNAAIAQAQETLPLFFEAFQDPSPGQSEFTIKAKVPYDNGQSIEHIWVHLESYDGETFEGILANEPVYFSGFRMGDPFTGKAEGISDWYFFEDDRLMGGFTIYIIREGMSAPERDQLDESLGILGDQPVLP